MHQLNYVELVNEADPKPKPILLPNIVPQGPHIIHHVINTDTLTRLSLRYGVPVGAIRKMNRLSSDEIWFRKTLLIPLSSKVPLGLLSDSAQKPTDVPVPEILESSPNQIGPPLPAPDFAGNELKSRKDPVGLNQTAEVAVTKKVEKHQRVLFLTKMTNIPTEQCRQIVARYGDDLPKSLRLCEWMAREMNEISEPLTAPEVLAYLHMNEFDTEQAHEALLRDLLWEQSQTRKQSRLHENSRTSLMCGMRRNPDHARRVHYRELNGASECDTEELVDMFSKNTRQSSSQLKHRRVGPRLTNDEMSMSPTVLGRRSIELEGKKKR